MSKTILIIDDSGSFRQVVKMALQRQPTSRRRPLMAKNACAKLDGPKSTDMPIERLRTAKAHRG